MHVESPNATAPPPLRDRAARFWLKALFRAAADAPWVVRLMRGPVKRAVPIVSRKVRENTAANARRIFGGDVTPAQQRRFSREVVASFYDFVGDVGQSTRASREALERRIESVQGQDHYAAARALKRGAVVVTAHMGSFEVGLAALLQREPPGKIHVVFKRDAIGLFEQLRSSLRQRLGVVEAPVDDGLAVWVRLRDALLNDEVVVLQGDRVMPGQKGRPVAMLGGTVMLPTGPVKLALATGSPILPIFSVRLPDGRVRIFIEPPIVTSTTDEGVAPPPPDVDALLARVAASIEKFVRAHPHQWLVLERAFCEDSDGANRRYTGRPST